MKRAFATASCAITLIATAAVTGCTDAATATEQGQGKKQSRSGQEQRLRDLTDAEELVLERAEAHLVRSCMKARGFTYWPGPFATVDERRSYAYVLDDTAWTKKHGYGGRLAKAAERARAEDPNTAYFNDLPHRDRLRYTDALEGEPDAATLTAELPGGGGTVETPATGCQAEARDRLYGGYERWFRAAKTAENLTPLYLDSLTSDRRFRRALTSWSTCMRKAGHAYASPEQLREQLPSLTEDLSEAAAHATEVELATTEATCAGPGRSGLADTARSLEREYRTKQLKRYAAPVATHQRLQLAALARAKNITDAKA
ncbi:hypothetical protein [Streptomyces sp. NPDC002851]